MANPQQNPTGDYRKYPKGPNFFGIVVGSSLLLILLLIGAWLLVRAKGNKMGPHAPNPVPNSRLILPVGVRPTLMPARA